MLSATSSSQPTDGYANKALHALSAFAPQAFKDALAARTGDSSIAIFSCASRARDGFRRGWLPWAKLQAVAKRCGLGTLDFRAVFSGTGAASYVSKYLTKSVEDADGSARQYALSVSIPAIKQAGWSWSPARVALVAIEQLGAVEVDWDAVRWEAPGCGTSTPAPRPG